MVPGLEGLGIRMLLNERVEMERGGERIHLAGIDNAHFHGSHSIEEAAVGLPREVMSHTPEVY